MTVQEQLHRLVNTLDGRTAKQQLHAVVDDLNEEQADVVLARMRGMRYLLEGQGFTT